MNYKNYVQKEIDEVCKKLKDKGEEKLVKLFENCFPNTLETTTEISDEKSTYIFTGDIPAMWLRDSSAQVHQYLPFCKSNEKLSNLIAGLIKRQVFYVQKDSYANAFNKEENDHGHTDDLPRKNAWVYERKYEIDSLCYVISLATDFYNVTGRTDIFDEEFFKSVNIIVDLFVTEQNHFEKSPYRFFRNTDRYDDTIHNNGMGAEVKYTGMTWSGFRPSDDACVYGYLIPSNLFAVTALRKLLKLPKEILNDKMLIEKATKLADEIEGGIQKYGIVEHPKYGKIYAYETDGMGNFVFMDDANVPSLIALPYIGCCDIDDEIYQNTRKFVLSEDNPYYFEGKEISGLGSPHTPKGFVWHIGLSLQGLTSNDKEERLKILRMLEKSDGDTGFMHEGVNSDNTKEFTRPWFAWSNSIFSEFLLDMVDEI